MAEGGLGRILLISDCEQHEPRMRASLGELPASLELARDARTGLELARRFPPDVALIDLDLPGGQGLRAFHSLRALPAWRPLLLVSHSDRPERAARALDLGASDYLRKSLDPREFRARVRFALMTKQRHDALERQALRDPLTDLDNRRALDLRLRPLLDASRERKEPLALWIADLDRFKEVNDHFGHVAGDRVLCWCASLLRQRVGGEDVVVRYGGEEFLVIAPGSDARGALLTAERFRADVSIHAPPGLPAGERMTVSAGIAVAWPRSRGRRSTLIRRADMALYAAKRAGRDVTWCWDDDHGRPVPAKSVSGSRGARPN